METKKKSVFVICSVRKAHASEKEKFVAYKQKLLSQGYVSVHLPHLDTNQEVSGYEICVQNTTENVAATQTHVFYEQTSEGLHFDIGVRFVDMYLHPEKQFYVVDYLEDDPLGILLQGHMCRLFEEKFQGYDRWIGILETMIEVEELQIVYHPQNTQASHIELGMIFALCTFFPEKRINIVQNRGIMDEHGQYFILFERSFGTMIVEWENIQKRKLI
ncbi:MAG: hypothetical protein WCL18_07275 [bacterium]